MSYVYRSVDVLQGKEKVGDGECVTLIKTYTNAGWAGRILVSAPAFVASPIYLNGAAPSDGPPEKRGILRGEAEKTTKSGWSHRYSLAGPYPEGKWLRCDYGTLGEFSLAKRLPDDIRECTVSGRKGEHAGENIIKVVCR